MKFVIVLAVFLGTCCESGLFAQSTGKSETADREILQLDRGFLLAFANGDKVDAARLLDDDFIWTDSAGKTTAKTELLQRLNKSSLTDDPDIKERVYGEVALVTSSHGRTHVARIWVKREDGWRLLTYDETTLLAQAGPVSSSGVSECENPCKALPYVPKNEAERGIIASWQALETAVTHHDAAGWAPHIADEFVLINANNDHPMTKLDRMAILDEQKRMGAGAAPVPLVTAQMFDFRDAVVMTAQHQRGRSKPIHVTRVWIKRDGQWVMAFSQQTTIQ